MPQCEATVKTTGRDTFGQQCRRNAVKGAKVCERHGGVEATITPAAVRKRLDHPRVRCHATRRNGEPCNNFAIRGGTVCTKHGGNMPHVKKAARERMLELIDPALLQLQRILTKPDTSDADRLRAITLLLDRTGHGAKSEVSVEVKPWERMMDEIVKTLPDTVVLPPVIEERPILAIEAGSGGAESAEPASVDDRPTQSGGQPEGASNPPPWQR